MKHTTTSLDMTMQRTRNGNQEPVTAALPIAALLVATVLVACADSTQKQEAAERRARAAQDAVADQQQLLQEFAITNAAEPLNLEDVAKDFSASAQDKLEGRQWAFRAVVLDVSREGNGSYTLHLGNSSLGFLTHTWLALSLPPALASTFLSPTGPKATSRSEATEILVAARLQRVQPITARLGPCDSDGVGFCEALRVEGALDVYRPRFLTGEAVAVEFSATRRPAD